MIAFNYEEAMRQSRELNQISDAVRDLAERILHSEQAELRSTWTGDSAGLFFQKTEELYKDITKTAKNASAVSKAVQVTAKAVKDAEDAAKELIRNAVKIG